MNDVAIDAGPRPAQLKVRREQFVFSGSTREYFGIWIVNVLLTIVTLGIYSAWAKVRRQRYFYGNTRLAGGTFDYHARPGQILIGRIVVVVMLLLYNGLATFAPLASLAVGVLFLFAVPWFIMRGLRFNARVTSYRNVRFDFVGGYWGAFLAYLVGGFLMYVSLGILAPLASQWMWNYTLGNVRYGGRPVRCEPRLGRLYGQWWLPASLVSGGLVMLATT
ncbi:YjgN family protein, partial [Rhizobiaceae sp. 2RAB30]